MPHLIFLYNKNNVNNVSTYYVFDKQYVRGIVIRCIKMDMVKISQSEGPEQKHQHYINLIYFFFKC